MTNFEIFKKKITSSTNLSFLKNGGAGKNLYFDLKANNPYNFYLYSIFTIFFKIMEDGRPWLDMAHVTACLNKLDAGVSEKVCLMSRDEQNVLVVSYSELRQCLDQSFSECIHSHRNSNVPSSVASATMGGYNWWWIVKTWDFFVKFHENNFTWFSQERTTVFILFFKKSILYYFWHVFHWHIFLSVNNFPFFAKFFTKFYDPTFCTTIFVQ